MLCRRGQWSRLSFRTLQRGNAVLDALRRTMVVIRTSY
ncbi:DUF1534 domain-containing protein [Pseudomonas sp. SZ57]|nr:DUF1534 domain-containing protein [Pseudomonas syringae]MDA3136104.1 DUF1534 domain-containing protein [Pseudomonas syringae]MQQ34418.1 DUF1534 domain-containing protein [Pseudomonas sp. SZ57]